MGIPTNGYGDGEGQWNLQDLLNYQGIGGPEQAAQEDDNWQQGTVNEMGPVVAPAPTVPLLPIQADEDANTIDEAGVDKLKDTPEDPAAIAQENYQIHTPDGDKVQEAANQSALPTAPAPNPATQKIVQQIAQMHPDLAKQPNGLAIINQLADRYLQGVAPGGQYSQEAREAAQNNLAPVNAAQQFGINQMKGAGTPNIVSNPATSDFNQDFSNNKASALGDLTGASSAMGTQIGAQQMANLPDVLKQAFSPQATPMQKYNAGMMLSLNPTTKGLGEALMKSPDVAAYQAQITKQGQNAAGNTQAQVNVNSKFDNAMGLMDQMLTANNKAAWGPQGPAVAAGANLVAGMTGSQSAHDITNATNQLNQLKSQLTQQELGPALQSMGNGSRMSKPLLALIQQANSIDMTLNPQDRAKAIQNLKQQLMILKQNADLGVDNANNVNNQSTQIPGGAVAAPALPTPTAPAMPQQGAANPFAAELQRRQQAPSDNSGG